MQIQPTYEELAQVVAHCVYARMYLPEPSGAGESKKIVDNMCSSAYQIPTGVLCRLDILEPLDELGRRSDFTCAPVEFGTVISRNRAKGCGYDTLVLALICLLEICPDEKNVYDCLVRLSVCEDRNQHPLVATGMHELSEPSIRWTEKKQHYDCIYKDWPDLIEQGH